MKKRQNLVVDMIALTVVVVAIVVSAILFFMTYSAKLNREDISHSINKNWVKVENGVETNVNLPTTFKADGSSEVIFKTKLPAWDSEFSHLYLGVQHCDVDVLIDGKCVYHEKNTGNGFSNTNGKRNVFVELPKEYDGKSLEIVYSPQIDIENYAVRVPQLCDKDDMMQSIYQINQPLLIIEIMIAMFGIISVILAIVSAKVMGYNDIVFAVGFVSLVYTIYLFSQNEWIGLITNDTISQHIFEQMAFMVLSIPLLFVLRYSLNAKKPIFIDILIVVATVNALAQTIIHFVTGISFRQMQFVTAIITVVAFVSAIVIPLFGRKLITKNRIEAIISMVPISVLVIINVFVSVKTGEGLGEGVLLIGIVAFDLIQGLFMVRGFNELSQSKFKEQFYKNMAYTDALTKLKNRNAYDREIQELINATEAGMMKEIAIVAIDVNGLKGINDTFGHIAGDNMITAMAEYLTKNFEKNIGIYRLGGDEFLVMTSEKNMEETVATMEEIRAHAKANAFYMDHHLSFSYGVTVYSKEKYDGITKAIREADVLMYNEKVRYYENEGNRRKK